MKNNQREIRPVSDFYSSFGIKETAVAPTQKATIIPIAAPASKVEPFYSIAEAAKLLNIPRRWIDDAINSGKLAFVQMGAKARKVKLSKINDYIEKHGGGRNA